MKFNSTMFKKITLFLITAQAGALCAMEESPLSATKITVEPKPGTAVETVSPEDLARIEKQIAEQEKADETTCLTKIEQHLNSYSEFSHKWKLHLIFMAYGLAVSGIVAHDLITEANTAPEAVFITSVITTLQGFSLQAVKKSVEALQKKHRRAGSAPSPVEAQEDVSPLTFCQKFTQCCKQLPIAIKNNAGNLVGIFGAANAVRSIVRWVRNEEYSHDTQTKIWEGLDMAELLTEASVCGALHIKTTYMKKLKERQLRERKKRGPGESVELREFGDSLKLPKVPELAEDAEQAPELVTATRTPATTSVTLAGALNTTRQSVAETALAIEEL